MGNCAMARSCSTVCRNTARNLRWIHICIRWPRKLGLADNLGLFARFKILPEQPNPEIFVCGVKSAVDGHAIARQTANNVFSKFKQLPRVACVVQLSYTIPGASRAAIRPDGEVQRQLMSSQGMCASNVSSASGIKLVQQGCDGSD